MGTRMLTGVKGTAKCNQTFFKSFLHLAVPLAPPNVS